MRRARHHADPFAALARMPLAQRRRALIELCGCGLITCTRGRPGDENATYVLAWLPLDNPERYPEGVRRHHSQNMLRLRREEGRA